MRGRERETDQRKKEEQGFGVDHRRLWIQFFRFSAQKLPCVNSSSLSADLTLLFFFFFVFSPIFFHILNNEYGRIVKEDKGEGCLRWGYRSWWGPSRLLVDGYGGILILVVV